MVGILSFYDIIYYITYVGVIIVVALIFLLQTVAIIVKSLKMQEESFRRT